LGPGAIGGIVTGSVGLVVIVMFLWHRYKIRRQERQYAKRAKAAQAQTEREQELNEFIAHEIRNPLASGIAALSFVSAQVSDPRVITDMTSRESVNSDLAVIEASLQFVNELLRNMLDLHRSADKRMKLDIVPTDILRDVFEPVASILFMRGAKVDIQTECPRNLVVETDRMRLKQIFLNLAANASKFVDSGYIRLRAEVLNNNVHVHVEDSGSGIPIAKRKLLFAKFQESLDMLNQVRVAGYVFLFFYECIQLRLTFLHY
jgi:signal transduction histidine kinase